MRQLAKRTVGVVLTFMAVAQSFGTVAFAAPGPGGGGTSGGGGPGPSHGGGPGAGPASVDASQVRSGSGGSGSSGGSGGDGGSGGGGSSGGPGPSGSSGSSGGGGGGATVSVSLDGAIRGTDISRSGVPADRGQPRLFINFNDRF